MNDIINFLINLSKTKITILIIVSLLFVTWLFIHLFTMFLRDVDYLKISLKSNLKILFELFKNLIKLFIKIVFFPITIIFLIIENHSLNKYIINNSKYKDIPNE